MSRLDLALASVDKFSLLRELTGCSSRIFNGRNQPCPYCSDSPKSDRFRLVIQGGDIAGYYCGRGYGCNSRGDYIGLIAHLKGDISYKEAVRVLEERLGVNKELTAEEKRQFAIAQRKLKEQQRIAEIKRKQREIEMQNIVSMKAVRIWERSQQVDVNHPYLINKKIKGVVCRQYKGMLVVPVVNMRNELRGLQFIGTDGSKRFIKGMGKKGAFCFIGVKLLNRPTVFCEGYATGETIHNLTGLQVIVCFDAGNIKNVAKLFLDRDKVQGRKGNYILFADNDLGKYLQMRDKAKSNPKINPLNRGSETIKELESIGIKGIQPRVEDDYDIISDWNDVYCEYGEKEFLLQVKEQYLKIRKDMTS